MPHELKTLLQLNTRVWLSELRASLNDPSLTLGELDELVFERWKEQGHDAVWLMGIWEPSPAGRKTALGISSLVEQCAALLPDFKKEEDIIASPFAVKDYVINPDLGNFEALRSFRASLHRQGMALILDFVPNHTALDHPWISEHPEYYIPGTAKELKREPEGWFSTKTGKGKMILAHGRDPKFPAWTDTAQLNIFHSGARKALIAALRRLAGMCDGVRCDMAMLLLNSVFRSTWAEKAPGALPKSNPAEFWEEAITAVRRDVAEFTFLAECYWDLEDDLLKMGFDYTYDKPLLDNLLEGLGQEALVKLEKRGKAAAQMVHFIENHDELRAAEAFGPTRSMAAALVTATVPGVMLVQEGQTEGWRVRLPLQLRRRPLEKRTRRIEFFYERLLRSLQAEVLRTGSFKLLPMKSTDAHLTLSAGLIAYVREKGNERRLIVANVGRGSARALVTLPANWLAGRSTLRLVDELSGATEEIPSQTIQAQGLLVDLSMGGHRLWKLLAD